MLSLKSRFANARSCQLIPWSEGLFVLAGNPERKRAAAPLAALPSPRAVRRLSCTYVKSAAHVQCMVDLSRTQMAQISHWTGVHHRLLSDNLTSAWNHTPTVPPEVLSLVGAVPGEATKDRVYVSDRTSPL